MEPSRNCTIGHFYILLYWILDIVIFLVQICIPEYFILVQGDIENELINLACISIADILAFILYLFCKKKTVINIAKEKQKQKKCCSLLLIFLISIFHLYSFSCFYLFYIKKEILIILQDDQNDWIYGIDILFRHIFSCCILKIKLYKHHIYSLIVSVIGIIILTASDISTICLEKKSINVLWYVIIILQRPFFLSLTHVINDKLFKEYNLLPHSLMFRRGLIELILFLIILTPIIIFTSQFQFTDLLYRILMKCGYIVLTFLQEFFLLKIIESFNVIYVSFLVIYKIIRGLLNPFLYENNKSDISINYIIDICALFLILVGSLINI